MDVNSYLKQLTRQISNSAARKSIMEEYQDHIDDQKEAYMRAGMEEKEAEEAAVLQMGDPVSAGKELNRLYRRRLDWRMSLFFVGMCCLAVPSVYVFSIYLFSTVPQFVSTYTGAFFLFFGFLWSVYEKYLDLPLFYAWGNNWNGGGINNSGLFLAISVAFLSTSWQSVLLWMVFIIVAQAAERFWIDSLREKKEASLLWETGVADTAISYKGRGSFHDRHMKVKTEEELIEKGTPIMITGLDGFKPIVSRL